jgi:N-succinyldiaminopimelate aminotransferase
VISVDAADAWRAQAFDYWRKGNEPALPRQDARLWTPRLQKDKRFAARPETGVTVPMTKFAERESLGHIRGAAALTDGTIRSPFTQLRELLDGITPGHARPIELTIGEPREAMPDFIAAKIAEAAASFGKYPPIKGSDELRAAIAAWIGRRSAVHDIDPATEILALNGSREGLTLACIPAVARKRGVKNPAIVMCNPYYSAYIAGALGCGAEAVFLNATRETGFLPDLDALAADTALLARTAALFIGSPSNPQGAVATPAYIAKALALARRHDLMLFFDECYSEIYTDAAPVGALTVAASTPERFRNLVVFNSLSKRSNLPGMRSGFCAGDPTFLSAYAEIRNMCAPQVPGPIQHASAAAWADEAHVEAARAVYRHKFADADSILSGHFGYQRPAGGFCLWLDMSHVGGGAKATVTLWKSFGVKVIPGAFLAQPGQDGRNPGDAYVRVALVQPADVVREALERIVQGSA